MARQTYSSANIGPQEGEPKYDGNETAIKWFCSCSAINDMDKEVCGCGKSIAHNVGLYYADKVGSE